MKIYFAADHAGFELKQHIISYVRRQFSYVIEDCGAHALDPADNYPEIIARAAHMLSLDAERGVSSCAIVFGASGEGEAVAANRFAGVRAVVYYGPAQHVQTDTDGAALSLIASTRLHNDSNCLSIGARFVTPEQAEEAVYEWLTTAYEPEKRHDRRIKALH